LLFVSGRRRGLILPLSRSLVSFCFCNPIIDMHFVSLSVLSSALSPVFPPSFAAVSLSPAPPPSLALCHTIALNLSISGRQTTTTSPISLTTTTTRAPPAARLSLLLATIHGREIGSAALRRDAKATRQTRAKRERRLSSPAPRAQSQYLHTASLARTPLVASITHPQPGGRGRKTPPTLGEGTIEFRAPSIVAPTTQTTTTQ
jgi:hypothetical protein